MTFKDQALLDLPTFVNVDEFGTLIAIDGIGSIMAVLMPDEVPGPTDDDGVTKVEQLLYVKVSDFPEIPVVRQRLVLDGRPANVTRVDVEQGMYTIHLTWFDS